MRKENKERRTDLNVRTVDGYHRTTDWSINYAFQGFQGNRYYTSDRYIALDENFNRADGKPLKGYGIEYYNVIARAMKRDLRRTRYCSAEAPERAWQLSDSYMPGSHGVAMNYSHWHEGRIEIRIPGGQSGYAAFRNTMEVAFFLVDRCKKISRADCDDIVKVFKGCNWNVCDRLSDVLREGHITAEQLEAIKAGADMVERYN